MKLMELIIQGEQSTGMFINKYNLLNNSLSTATNASLNIIEALGWDSGVPAAPVANSVFARYLAAASSDFRLTTVYCRDVYSVTDFAQVNLPTTGWAGTRAGLAEPNFVVAKLRSSRTRQDIKAGYKALPALIDTDISSAVGTLNGAYVTLAAALATALSDGVSPFVGPLQAFFGWAIVQKEEYETPSGKKAYRYYADPVEQADHIASPVTWTVQPRSTTQNTRKYGRGR